MWHLTEYHQNLSNVVTHSGCYTDLLERSITYTHEHRNDGYSSQKQKSNIRMKREKRNYVNAL